MYTRKNAWHALKLPVCCPLVGACHRSYFTTKKRKETWSVSSRWKRYHGKGIMNMLETERLSLVDRLFGWWYRIAAPPEVSDTAPLRDRMRVRSGRLTSVIFLLAILSVFLFLIVALLNAPFVAPTLITLLAALLMGVFLNRMGKTTIAGISII